MNESKALTIATLPIKAMEKLTTDARNRLVKIVEQEFTNKESLYHQIQQEESNKVIGAYKKKVGFDKLLKDRKTIEDKQKKLVAELEDNAKLIIATGLDISGEPRKTSHYVRGNDGNGHYVYDYEAKELNDLLNTIESNGPTQNLKNKLVTRITLACTIGEANVIMREVLGNGLIQSLRKQDLEGGSND
jgi:hypothetical protein